MRPSQSPVTAGSQVARRRLYQDTVLRALAQTETGHRASLTVNKADS
jgi:hypothetical protein